MGKKMYQVPHNEWQKPQMKNYTMGCCDCGLVHNMDFKVIDEQTEKEVKGMRVIMRARRNEFSTKYERKKMKIDYKVK